MNADFVAAQSAQRARPVVAVQCDADLGVCRALVQALSELAPTHNFRINPSPLPQEAFEVRLDLTTAQEARLLWQDGGAGQPVVRASLSATDLAQKLVTASPDLPSALRAHP